MVDHATAKYLNDNVGSVLAKALAEMSIAQPTDGVGFLAGWLKTYAEQEEQKAWREQEEKTLEEERAKTKAKLDEQEAKRKEQLAEIEKKDNKYKDFMSKMASDETVFEDASWSNLIEVAQSVTGAKAVYLGLCDEEGLEGVEGKCIYYTHTSAGSEAMAFFQAPAGSEMILTQDKGVTWNALAENPGEEVDHLWKPPKVETAVPEGEAAEGDAAQAPAMPYFPVHIPCVTDVEKDEEKGKNGVHYFEMTRLGSYVAVPLVYSTYYRADALTDAAQYEENQKAAYIAAAEAAEVYKQALAHHAEAAAGEHGEVEKPSAPPLPENQAMVLRGVPVKMVLCLDTLGTSTAIDEAKIADLLELAKAACKCKEATEIKQVDAQARASLRKPLEARALEVLQLAGENPGLADESRRILAEEELREKLETDIPQSKAEVAAALQDEENQADANAGEDEQKDLIQKQYAYLRARNVAVHLKDIILELKSWVVASPEFMNVLAAIAFMYGYTKESLYPKRKPMLKWDKLKMVLNDSFFEAIKNTEISGSRKNLNPEQKLSSIQAMGSPEGYDEAKAKEVSPAFELLYTLVQAACAYRKADLAVRKKGYDDRKAAKEEAGEAFDEPCLTELDDDFAE